MALRRPLCGILVLLAAAAWLLAGQALGAEQVFESCALRIEVAQNGTCHETIDLLVRNNGSEPIRNAYYTMAREVRAVAVRGVGEELRWEEAEDERVKLLNITFEYPVLPGASRAYSIAFDTDRFVLRDGDSMELRTTYNPSSPIASFSLAVVLPPGYVLPAGGVASQGTSVVYPPAELKTDGRHLILVWARENVTSADSIGVFARFTRAPGSCPPLTLGGVLAGFALGCVATLVWRRASRPRPSVLSVFTEDEQAVVAAMADAGGAMKQRDLLRAVDMSKSKLSRLLMDLESRGVVGKERAGNVNRLSLREDLRSARTEPRVRPAAPDG